MLDTLLKIGEWQRGKLSKWDRILDKPNVKRERRGKPVTNYVIGLVFDLDDLDVYPDPDLLKEYDELDGRPGRFWKPARSGYLSQVGKEIHGNFIREIYT